MKTKVKGNLLMLFNDISLYLPPRYNYRCVQGPKIAINPNDSYSPHHSPKLHNLANRNEKKLSFSHI